ncbi:MAG: coproporphyrinogen dehydrogenase HemZ [Ruminococcaceae bacterium]|nr:coproporphyrinogen dehydrogenase HemZ [Oscillospiraceae bacterium]
MKLFIDGDINNYYVQTLCMLFFPGAKFSQEEELTENSDVLSLTMRSTESGVTAYAEMRSGGRSVKKEWYEPYKEGFTKVKSAKIASGVAVLAAGEALFECTPPWGIMTGVRPAKIALPYVQSGMTTSRVRDALCSEYFLNPKKAALLTDIAEKEAVIIKNTPNDTCSVYISIPFCPTRCAYCSFVSYSTKRLLSMIDDYLEKLYQDIDRIFDNINRLGLRVLTVYVGGGTPTVLNPDQIAALLGKITSRVDPATLAEFTYEAGRPDTVTEEKMKVIKSFGVTRVSVNPQTLNDMVLDSIGRHHTTEDFYRAYNIARESGIKHINTDLIAGLPSESFTSFSRSVDEIIKLRPDNITFHTFCVKKAADILKTGNDVYSRTGGDTGKSVDYSQVAAGLAGYMPYYIYRQKNTVGNFENVGYALDGAEGLYNIYMMEEIHSVFAAGAGAVTKLVAKDGSVIKRAAMPKYPYEYLSTETYDRVTSDRDALIESFANEYL